jgi:uncharacterized protein YjbI with pentapeptide repeats
MANKKQVALLKKGVDAWNAWRAKTNIRPYLSGADLGGADLRGADLGGANLMRANLRGANLSGWANLSGANLFGADLAQVHLGGANLSGANLSGADIHAANLGESNLGGANLSRAFLFGANLGAANLMRANLRGANLASANLMRANLSRAYLAKASLTGAYLVEANLGGTNLRGAYLIEANLGGTNLMRANLRGADLSGAYLRRANLTRANLSDADLSAATLVDTDLTDTNLTGCRIYGVSAWGLKLERTKQQNLIITARGGLQPERTKPLITSEGEPDITVDNIEVAQFIYLLLHNEKLRDVIDTITSKAVLILGRFTPKRKKVLNALRQELRQHRYVPIMFDFEKPDQTRIETITLLARMARFIIADISDAKSVLQELQAIVPGLPSVPVQPVIVAMQEEPGMFDFFRRYPWFLKIYRYDTTNQLIANLNQGVIGPAEDYAALMCCSQENWGCSRSTSSSSKGKATQRRLLVTFSFPSHFSATAFGIKTRTTSAKPD